MTFALGLLLFVVFIQMVLIFLMGKNREALVEILDIYQHLDQTHEEKEELQAGLIDDLKKHVEALKDLNDRQRERLFLQLQNALTLGENRKIVTFLNNSEPFQEAFRTWELTPWWTIINPGKFEGEMWYAPYLYETVVGGQSWWDEDLGEAGVLVEVDDELRKSLGLTPDTAFLHLFETDQGFFCVYALDEGEKEALLNKAEEGDEDVES